MASSGMLRGMTLVRTDVSEKLSASIIRVTRIGELGTLAVTSNRRNEEVLCEPLLFFQVVPHLSSQWLSGPRSRPTATQKIWQRRESKPGPLDLQPGSLTT
jgi:hypothetical protein